MDVVENNDPRSPVGDPGIERYGVRDAFDDEVVAAGRERSEEMQGEPPPPANDSNVTELFDPWAAADRLAPPGHIEPFRIKSRESFPEVPFGSTGTGVGRVPMVYTEDPDAPTWLGTRIARDHRTEDAHLIREYKLRLKFPPLPAPILRRLHVPPR